MLIERAFSVARDPSLSLWGFKHSIILKPSLLNDFDSQTDVATNTAMSWFQLYSPLFFYPHEMPNVSPEILVEGHNNSSDFGLFERLQAGRSVGIRMLIVIQWTEDKCHKAIGCDTIVTPGVWSPLIRLACVVDDIVYWHVVYGTCN